MGDTYNAGEKFTHSGDNCWVEDEHRQKKERPIMPPLVPFIRIEC